MGAIERSDLDRVAMAHRTYCQSVPMMPWMRLSDGEYEAIIRAAQPRGAVEALEAFAIDKWGTTNPVLVPEDERELQRAYYAAHPGGREVALGAIERSDEDEAHGVWRCQHCPNLADERSFMCEGCAQKADTERQDLAEQLRGAVETLREAREWIDNAGDFMARPMDLLARMDAELPDRPGGR